MRSAERAQEYYRIINGEAKKLTRLIENILDFSRMEAGPAPVPHGAGRPRRVGHARCWREMETPVRAGQFTVDAADRAGPAARRRRRGRRRAGDREPARQRDEVLGRRAATSRSTSARANGHVVRQRHATTASASRGASRGGSSASSIASTAELGGGPQGTGLGLAIVDHTMRGHGGFVRVESEPRRGSTFTLHFPIPAETRAAERWRRSIDEAHSGDRGRAADAARSA